MDVLADVLSATKIGGTVTAGVTAAAPWALEFPGLPTITFHYVLDGSCRLLRPGAAPLPLPAGSLVLLPAGAAHTMSGEESVPARRFEDVAVRRPGEPAVRVDFPGPGPVTRVLCGGYRFDARAAHPLLNLPPVLLIATAPADDPDPAAGVTDAAADAALRSLTETLRMLTAELADPAPGSQTITDRLVDVLFVQVLRHWSAREAAGPAGPPRWLTALHAPDVAAAVTLIHQNPAHPWTVDSLARAAGVSRATLSRRFSRLVGEPPAAYLTRWRLEIAARRLRETPDSVTAIAGAVGYASEFAFSRAFRRHRGMPPSRYRKAYGR